MIELFHEYPYLWLNLVWVLIVLALSRLRRFRGKGVILAGLLLTPAGLSAPLYESAYWSPVRVGGGAFGIEDLLFSFLTGSAAWLIVMLTPVGRSVTISPTWDRALRTLAWWFAVSSAVFLALIVLGADPMVSLLVITGGAAAVFARLRPDLLPPAIVGSIGFGSWYCLNLFLDFTICPQMSGYWNQASAWASADILGLPLLEVIWGYLAGFCAPLYCGMALGAGCRTS